MLRSLKSGLFAFSALALVACGGSDSTPDDAGSDISATSIVETVRPGSDVNGARISAARATPEDWLTYGGTYDEQRHSLLTKVDTDNVDQLGVAWTYDLSTARGVEATPIVVDGVMYVTSAWSVVHALDAVTGDELWVYDPGVDRARGVAACCDVVNRGVAIWEGKVFVGTIDGRLVALDSATGDVVWDTLTVDLSQPYTITGAPRVVKGRVLIGNGGAELGVRGYISAYDADTGNMDWRFYTAPNSNKQPDGAASDSAFERIGNITWGDDGRWTSDGGGGTVWDSIVYDDVNDLILFGVGNGSPWNRDLRDPSGGDNLFLSSIVAVQPETGEYVWHFQTTPGDNWDYTATQTIILADLPLGPEGASRRVAMQAPKNGFFYVLDAATGEFLSGNNFVPQTWTTGLDETGRPIEVEASRYGTDVILQSPGPLGAHNWHPMAYNPDEGLAYIPAQELPQAYQADALFEDRATRWNTGVNLDGGNVTDLPPGFLKGFRTLLKGRLIAWDPVAQEPRWSVEHATTWNGGVLSTAGGLVFQGRLDGSFSAYDAANGDLKWTYDLKSGAGSGPGTYEIDGEQYVSITTGWGSAYGLVAGFDVDKATPTVGKVVTFKLGGTGTITAAEGPMIERVPAVESFGDTAMLDMGRVQYSRNCGVCHGSLAVSSGILPDLRWSAYAGDARAWNGVVLEGNLENLGMVSFADYVTEEESEAIRAYVIHRAHQTLANEAAEATAP
ncbi:MAG: PQQ-dependent dehydrogenase, methanol/ethanol family [Hyphomonadaceae bacterium]